MADPSSRDLRPLIARLREASRQTVRRLGFLASGFGGTGCTHSQCHTLMELEARGRLAVGELAEILCQDKSTASRIASRLQKRGLVQAAADREDGRCKLLFLTEAGRRKVAAINEAADRQVAEALAVLDERQIDAVVEGMALYAKALERGRRLAGVEIRPLRPGDDPDLAHVIRQVMTEFGAVGCGYSIEDPEVDGMSAAYAGPLAVYFVATRDGRLLGGAGIGPLAGSDDPQVCELRKMYLLPPGRGLGLGRQLMDRCLAAARERGYRRIYLETLDHMCQARHLYDKYGFVPLDGPLGDTGHCGCNRWAARDL